MPTLTDYWFNDGFFTGPFTGWNQPFGSWDEIFPDKAMTVAAIDRLVHHAVILEMNADSYRRKAAITRMSDQDSATTATAQREDKKPNRRARDN